jgi:hypothetical protein
LNKQNAFKLYVPSAGSTQPQKLPRL